MQSRRFGPIHGLTHGVSSAQCRLPYVGWFGQGGSREAAGRRRWTAKHDEQQKANLKAAAHRPHTFLLGLCSSHTTGIHIFTWLASSSLSAFGMDEGRKRRPLKAEVKPATEMR